MTIQIRIATEADAAAIATIYNHYIRTSCISFEQEAVTPAVMAQRIAEANKQLAWLVAEQDHQQIIGYAYATPWRSRSAYRYSVESSVYLDHQQCSKGVGTQLYLALLAILANKKIHTVIAGIAQPNAASVALHEKLGFEKVAHFKEVGFKMDRWIDVGYWQRSMQMP